MTAHRCREDRLRRTSHIVLVVVLVLGLDKILIPEDENEDEDDKYQIRSPESAPCIKLQFFFRSDWPLFRPSADLTPDT